MCVRVLNALPASLARHLGIVLLIWRLQWHLCSCLPFLRAADVVKMSLSVNGGGEWICMKLVTS